jgi:hypothetical protein
VPTAVSAGGRFVHGGTPCWSTGHSSVRSAGYVLRALARRRLQIWGLRSHPFRGSGRQRIPVEVRISYCFAPVCVSRDGGNLTVSTKGSPEDAPARTPRNADHPLPHWYRRSLAGWPANVRS